MKRKYIDFYERREEAKKKSRKSERNLLLNILVVTLVFLILSAGFLIVDKMITEYKTGNLQKYIEDPENMAKFQELENLKQREASYLSIKNNLNRLKEIGGSYPDVGKDFFEHINGENLPSLTLSSFTYDASSGRFSMYCVAGSYEAWDAFVSKIENSNYITDYQYTGYQRNLSNDTYSSAFNFKLVKQDK